MQCIVFENNIPTYVLERQLEYYDWVKIQAMSCQWEVIECTLSKVFHPEVESTLKQISQLKLTNTACFLIIQADFS
jgi:hypothetical protein